MHPSTQWGRLMTRPQFRLVTRSDFDGLVCGVLLKELNLIDEVAFVHPKDRQDGKIAISGRDITTNLPYVTDCLSPVRRTSPLRCFLLSTKMVNSAGRSSLLNRESLAPFVDRLDTAQG